MSVCVCVCVCVCVLCVCVWRERGKAFMSDKIRYAVSEGGDSLLDSEEEKELIPEDLSLPLPAQQTSSMVNEDSKTPTNHKLAPSPPPSSLSPSLLNTLFTQCRQSSGKPKVIQLDKRRSKHSPAVVAILICLLRDYSGRVPVSS